MQKLYAGLGDGEVAWAKDAEASTKGEKNRGREFSMDGASRGRDHILSRTGGS